MEVTPSGASPPRADPRGALADRAQEEHAGELAACGRSTAGGAMAVARASETLGHRGDHSWPPWSARDRRPAAMRGIECRAGAEGQVAESSAAREGTPCGQFPTAGSGLSTRGGASSRAYATRACAGPCSKDRRALRSRTCASRARSTGDAMVRRAGDFRGHLSQAPKLLVPARRSGWKSCDSVF